jgi:putative glutamine amidotransferase
MRPLIGIPPCLDDRGRWRNGRKYHYIDAAYAEAVQAAGGSAVYLPQKGSAPDLVQHLDGLLVPGGDDLAPPRPYPNTVHFDLVPPAQLQFDTQLLGAALRREIPVLGICYGMQLLVQAFGGSLVYDIATDLPQAGEHQLPEPSGRHPIEIAAGSRLADLWRAPDVNSLHHQAAAEAGALRVVARAPDGVIEAIEGEGSAFVLGVQWHPEKHDAATRAPLFEGFIRACAGQKPSP